MSLSKMDCVVDQEKYLREATRCFRGIEKPLKYGPKIGTLKELITTLYKEFETNYVNIEMINHLFLSYESNPKEWQKFAKFDRFKYTRNLVDAGNGKFNLMILCWGEGHSSAIHDHSNSHCFMKMLKGQLKETRYMIKACERNSKSETGNQESNEENELCETGQSVLGVNEVCYINDNIALHRVENPSHIDAAVSLHLYCPPFNECKVFQKNSGKSIKCPVTFWSKYGSRQPKNLD